MTATDPPEAGAAEAVTASTRATMVAVTSARPSATLRRGRERARRSAWRW